MLSQIKGIAHFISRVPRSLKVNTPFVNAAIEGTEFVVAIGDQQTEVTVFEGETAEELAHALDEGILCINVESEPELELLSTIASSKGRNAHISVRVNPDIDPRTHHKIATGKARVFISCFYNFVPS